MQEMNDIGRAQLGVADPGKASLTEQEGTSQTNSNTCVVNSNKTAKAALLQQRLKCRRLFTNQQVLQISIILLLL
jgi:hypothetical protein